VCVRNSYEYSNELMLSISALKTYFNLPFRQTEGILKAIKLIIIYKLKIKESAKPKIAN
jgi:hypothetical protein